MMGWLLFLILVDVPPERVPWTPLPATEAARREALTRFGLGRWRAREERPASAAKEFEAAAKADPDSPGPLRPLVAVYAELGRHAAAIRTARKVLELDPDDADTAHKLGQILYEGRKYADAVTVLKQAASSPRLERAPAIRLGILRDLARAAEAARDPATAAATLTEAATFLAANRPVLLRAAAFIDPRDLDREEAALQASLGDAYRALKKFDSAATAYRESARIYRGPARQPERAAVLHWQLCQLLSDQGKVDESLEELNRFLAFRPVALEPYLKLGELYRRLNQPERGIAALSQLDSQKPAIPAVRWALTYEAGRRRPEEFERNFRELAETTSEPAFFALLVRFYAETNRATDLLEYVDRLYTAAQNNGADKSEPAPDLERSALAATERARQLTAAIKANPAIIGQLLDQAELVATPNWRSETWQLLTGLAEQVNRTTTVEVLLRRAVSNGAMELFTECYRVLYRQRKWNEILDLCDQAERESRNRNRGGSRPLFDLYRASPLAELGRGADALQLLERAKVNATSRFGVRLEKARVLIILDRYQEALKECEDIIVEFPRPDDVRSTRIVISNACLGMKDFPRAEQELRQILEDDPDDILALNNLGYNLADQGRKLAEAEEMVRRAIELERDERLRTGHPEADSGTYLDSLGWVLFRRGKLEEARAALEQSARLPDSTTDPIVWDHLGDVRFRLGDTAGARQAWQAALERYTDSHTGRQHGRLQEVQRKLRQVP